MSQTVEISLVEILNRLERKIDGLDNKVENRIGDLESKIEGKIDVLESKIDHLSNEINEVKVDVATLKEGQTSLKETVKGIETRVNTLIAVAFTGLLGIIAKLIFLK